MPLTHLDITSDSPYAGGEPFGDTGPYRELKGTAHLAVDPNARVNSTITDIDLAPTDSEGRVRFSSHFAMLMPADPGRGNRRLFFDVCNRGNRTVFNNFNSAGPAEDPAAPLAPGNGFLLRHGYTVVWCGWQADVPPTPGLIGMQVPHAVGPDGPITGRIMNWFQVDEQTTTHMLSDREHLPHPAADPYEPSAALYVRDHPNGPMTQIDRSAWSFVSNEDEDATHVLMDSGFEPGRIYQLVYASALSRVVGLGFAAVRDAISFLKYEEAAAGNPAAGLLDHAYAFGRSQSGRFLRNMLHAGVNEDEAGRMALDGVIAHVAGAMRGEFNLRFGQPSKDICFVMPELFPFTDTPQVDPVTGRSGSLLERLDESGMAPRTMFVNTSAEYWRGDAALIHTDLETMADAPEQEYVRRYHFAGTQHGSGTFPPQETRLADNVIGQVPYNTVDYNPLLRACLVNLDRWVTTGDPAPPSRHPSLNDGTAVESHTLRDRFEAIPGAIFPPRPTRAIRLDYGPDQALGRTTKLPPGEGETYPALVSDVDDDGNEVGGIRLPDVSVPLATNTGWNLRHPDVGNPDLVIGVTGGLMGWTLPFAVTRQERESTGDPRPSIEERYASEDDYAARVVDAAAELAAEGYLLSEDVAEVVESARTRYRYWTGEPTPTR